MRETVQTGRTSTWLMWATEFYVAEAELLLAEARTKGKSLVLGPGTPATAD
jgi:hypothetical protein